MATTKRAKTKRTRKRSVSTNTGTTDVPVELTQLAVTFYTANKEMNAAKRESEAARKELYGGMKERGIKTFDLTTNIDGAPIILDVEVGEGRATTEISVEKLFRLHEDGKLPKEKLIQMLSATKKSVEEIGGNEVLAQVAQTKAGKENVTVKPHK